MPELARIETVVVLQTVDLFASCSAEQILRISGIARQRSFAAGSVIYRANDPSDALYCLVRGRVELSGAAGPTRQLTPLETFGVAEILSGRLRSWGATAEEPTLVLAIEADDFFDLLANNIDIVRALFRRLLRHQVTDLEDRP